jgi:2-dehydropantoate 2-reductase
MTTPSKTTPQPRIHVLGVGNLGRLFAHALANQPSPPPITLLLHRPSLLPEWEAAGRTISLTTHGVTNSSGTYSVETPDSDSGETISNLIVATKTLHTTTALESVRHRLNSESTVLFLQNGMGTTEEVTRFIFSDPKSRPSYLAAITSHGVYSESPFRSVFAGQAHVSIGSVGTPSPAPQDPSHPNILYPSQLQSRYLLEQIVNAPLLNATAFESRELKMLQLEKLVVNAMINPLTVIFNCKNGELFTRSPITRVMRLLLREASMVVSRLPELRPKQEEGAEEEDVEDRFSIENLEVKVLDVAEKTAANTSSMLQDFRAGRETEVGYINGYIVKRGKEMGIDVRHNEKVVEMIKNGDVIGDALERGVEEFPQNGYWSPVVDLLSVFHPS